jgi:hypothetical protein
MSGRSGLRCSRPRQSKRDVRSSIATIELHVVSGGPTPMTFDLDNLSALFVLELGNVFFGQ